MVTKMKIIFKILLSIAIFSGCDADQTVKLVAPPQDWYTAVVGSDFTARCESDGPVVWRKRNEDLNLTAQINKEDNTYVSKLALKNLTYRYVGFYDCVSLYVTSDGKASFYLYVDDPAHLSLGLRSLNVNGWSYQPAVVPCRPTTPDVSVRLLTPQRDLMAPSTTRTAGPDDWHVYFDPRRGFIMPAHLMEPAWFSYFCVFSKGGVIEEIKVDLQISAPGSSETTVKNILAKLGDTLVLPVEVFTESRPNNTWIVHRDGDQDTELAKSGVINERSNKIRVEDTDGFPWESRVVIQDFTENDAGVYTLTSDTKSGRSPISTTFYVFIEATDELSMEIPKVIKIQDNKSIHAFCLRKLDDRNFEAKWSFKPLDCTDSSCEEDVPIVNPLDLDKCPSKDLLSAAVLEVPRLGNLTCSIYSDYGFVDTVSKPVVLSEVEDGFEVRKQPVDDPEAVTLQCIVSKYLYSDLYWLAPEGHVIDDSAVSDNGTYTKLTKSVNKYSYMLDLRVKNFNQSGEYRCMAVNNDHKPEFKTYLMNTPVAVPSHFFANLDNNTLLVPSTSTVTLSCDRDWTQTSPIVWRKDDNLDLIFNQTRLEMKNVTSDHSGKYTCLPSTAGSKLAETIQGAKFTQVIVYEPDIKNEDMDEEEGNGLNTDTLEQEALLCHLHGQSSSKVVWYKNGAKLQASPRKILNGGGSRLVIHPLLANDSGLYSCKSEEAGTDASLTTF